MPAITGELVLGGRRVTRAGGPLDHVDDDRVRSAVVTDRGDGLLPAHAHPGGVARPAGLGGGADPAVGGRDDHGRLDHVAGGLALRSAWRGPALGTARSREHGESGSERSGRAADGDRAGDRAVAIVCADRRLRAADAPSAPCCRRSSG